MSGENVKKAKNDRVGKARAAAPLALLFAAIVIASFAFFSYRVRGNEVRLCDGVAHGASETVASFVGAVAASGTPLTSAIEENPTLWKADIASMAKKILDARPYVVGVSVAPSAIVKYHFPEDGDESLVGHDLLSNPERRDVLTLAVERKTPVLSGPYESVDGERVLFVRDPVFVGGKLWGFTSLTVDFEAMLKSMALEKRFPGFSFALSDSDYIAGDKKAFVDLRVTAPIALPGANWTLHVIPAAGWSTRDPFLLILLVAGLAGALLLFVALWRRPASAASGLTRPVAPAKPTELSPFDLAVKEARRHVASRERASPGEALDSLAEADTPEAVVAEANESGAAYGIASADSPSLRATTETPREIRFLGPAVRGELYMPEKLIAGEPGSLFERFATVEQPGRKPEHAIDIAAPSNAPQKPIQAKTPLHGPILTPKPQKEFPFTVEEPLAAKPGGAKKEPAILVVDDSEVNREIMGRMLALRGYRADFASSGEEALASCARRAYDVVFMDCFMPGMDGYRTSAAIRERCPDHVRTIVGMSARIGDQEVERCRQAGMDDLLAKPFALKQLLAHLESL